MTEGILRFTDLLPGILRTLPRVPSLFKASYLMQTMSMDDYNSIGRVVETNAERYPDKLSLLYEDQTFTHKEFNKRVNKYAHFFHSKGLKKGDVVGIFVENRPELIMLITALSKLGVVSSLMNPKQKGKVLLHSINLTCKDVYVVGEEMLEAFEEIRPDLNITGDENTYYLPDGTNCNVPAGFQDLNSLIEPMPEENPDTTKHVKLSDPYAYVFTSGTTGLPKASVQLHFRWLGAGRWFALFNMGLTADDTMYIPLPMYHTNGLNVAWSSAAVVGGTIALRRKFSASNFLNDARKFNATAFVYIGEICRYLMNQPEQSNDSQNPIQKMVGNGLRPDIWKSFKKRFDIPFIYELYGAAEGSSIFTNFLNIDCSVGVCPTPYAIVKYDVDAGEPIRNEQGLLEKVEKGEPGLMLGKITAKSPFIGYTSKKETEKKVLRDVFKKGDMWFDTGDLLRDIGFRHAQFVDRLGDTFRWKGENVSTTEVEEIVNQMDGISGSTVYGVEIPGTEGRAGMVSVISENMNDDIDRNTLTQKLKEALPNYAVPIFLRVKTQFDTTVTYKIKKTDLKSEGFSPELIKDPLYVLLPGGSEYELLSPSLYQEILNGNYKF